MRKIFCKNVICAILVLQFVFLSVILMQGKSYADAKAPSITGTSIGAQIGQFTKLYSDDKTASGSLTLNIDKTSIIYLIDSTQLCGDMSGENNTITASQVQNWACSSSQRPSYIDYGVSQYVIASTGGGTYTNNNLTGLMLNTNHYIYVVLLQSTDDYPSNVLGPYTLQDKVRPTVISGYPKTKNNDRGVSIDLVVESSKASTAYYSVILASTDTTGGNPSASSVITGISGATTDGSIAIDSANTEKSTTIGNLFPGLTYNIYVALKDQNGNISDTATKIQIKTAKITISLSPSSNNNVESDGKEQDGSEGWKLQCNSSKYININANVVDPNGNSSVISFDKPTKGKLYDVIDDNCQKWYSASSYPGVYLLIENSYLGSGWSYDTTDHLSDGKTIKSSLFCYRDMRNENTLILETTYPNRYSFGRYHRITVAVCISNRTIIVSDTKVIKTYCK